MASKPTTVQEYIDASADLVRARLQELRSYLEFALPNAVHVLKWGKPALEDNGIVVVYAGCKTHVSLHPTPTVILALSEDLNPYSLSQNTIRFPLESPIPKELVLEIARLRAQQKEEDGVGWR